MKAFLCFEAAGLALAAGTVLIAWRGWYWPGWLVMAGAATGGNLAGLWSVHR